MQNQLYDSSHIVFFFFNDTATTEIYTLSLHDALPISRSLGIPAQFPHRRLGPRSPKSTEFLKPLPIEGDRKSTRLNSSHGYISYAVFCLKKKKKLKARVCFTQLGYSTDGTSASSADTH